MKEHETKIPVLEFFIDSPLSLRYDEKTGVLQAETPAGTSSGPQAVVRLHISSQALQELYMSYQALEKTADTPPSAHTRPRTRQ